MRIVFAEYIHLAFGALAVESYTCGAAAHAHAVDVLDATVAVDCAFKHVGHLIEVGLRVEHPYTCMGIAPVGEIELAFAHCASQWRRAVGCSKLVGQICALCLELSIEYLHAHRASVRYIYITEQRTFGIVIYCHATAVVIVVARCIGEVYARCCHALVVYFHAPCIVGFGEVGEV